MKHFMLIIPILCMSVMNLFGQSGLADRGELTYLPKRIVNHLQLDTVQEKQIALQRMKYKKEILELRSNLIVLRTKKALAMTAPTPERKKIFQIIDQMAEIQKEIQIKSAKHILSMREILSDDQRFLFDQFRLNHRREFTERNHFSRPKRDDQYR